MPPRCVHASNNIHSEQYNSIFQASTFEEPPDDNLYLGIVLTAVVVITGKFIH